MDNGRVDAATAETASRATARRDDTGRRKSILTNGDEYGVRAMSMFDRWVESAFSQRTRRKAGGTPALYAVFLALAVLPPLFYVGQPLLHDEMTYLVIGRELAAGGALYSGIADHKPPAVFYLTALLWEVTPEPYLVGRILVYAVNAVTALLLLRLGSQWGRSVGIGAGLAYLVGVYAPVFDGYILMTEPFAAACLTGAVGCLFAERRLADLLAGFSLSVGVLFNQTTLLFGVVIIGWSLVRLYTHRTTLREIAGRYALIGTAFATPLGLTALYAARNGTLADMFWYTVVLPLTHYDTPYFLDGQLVSAASYLPVWLLAVGTAVAVLGSIPSRSVDDRLALCALWLFVVSIPGLRAFHGGHRYIFVMPAAAILASVGLVRITGYLASTSAPALSARGWAGLALAAPVSVAVLAGATGGSRYVLLFRAAIAGVFVGAVALSYGAVRWTGRLGRLRRSQWAALVLGCFVALVAVGGAAGLNGLLTVNHADDRIEPQAAAAENLDQVVDGRFYALGPPTRYELAYFGEARPIRTFITPPYGEPLAEQVTTTLERNEVAYVLVPSEQVTDGRIDPDHGYYAETRRPVVAYIQANYEPVDEREGFVIYERATTASTDGSSGTT